MGSKTQPPAKQNTSPANTTRYNNDGLMLGQRRRQWLSIKPAFFQRLVFAGLLYNQTFI